MLFVKKIATCKLDGNGFQPLRSCSLHCCTEVDGIHRVNEDSR